MRGGSPFDKLRDRSGVLRERRAVLPSTGSGTAQRACRARALLTWLVQEGTYEEPVVIYLYKWVLITRVLIRNMGMWGVGASFGTLSYLVDNKVVM